MTSAFVRYLRIAGLVLGICFASKVMSQDVSPTNRIQAAAVRAADLTFPDKPSELGFFSMPAMALYKPTGEGPFPALVIQHQCGGLRSPNGNWQNISILQWARVAVARGYVTLVIDSLGPRGVDTVCSSAKGNVNFMRAVRDAFQAAAHLKTLDYVDKDRIAHAGFSWGAMVSLALSGKTWGNALGEGTRFTAAVAFYPGCFTIRPVGGAPYELLNPDVDRPLLVLMGERDNETPPSDCIPKLQAAKGDADFVQWHVYPATHCWDCKNLNNFQKVDSRGNQVIYQYDEVITKDSETRMFEFLGQSMR